MTRSGEVVTEVISTADVPERQQVDFWMQRLNETLFAMSVESFGVRPGEFPARLVRQATPRYTIDRIDTPAGCLRRAEPHIRQDSDDRYLLALAVSGSLCVTSPPHRTDRIQPGTAGLVGLESPFEIGATPGRTWLMSIPRAEIDRRLNPSAPLTLGFDFTQGLGRVVAEMLRSLHEERGTLTAPQFDAVCDRLAELLCMLSVGDDRPDTGSLVHVAATVRRYIREHAQDPTLTGESVADALGWSRRQLQLAMQRTGTTLRDVIKDERLRLVHERLLSPACRHLNVSQIAAASGFTSLSSLSTAFRERYGASPRAYRADHTRVGRHGAARVAPSRRPARAASP